MILCYNSRCNEKIYRKYFKGMTSEELKKVGEDALSQFQNLGEQMNELLKKDISAKNKGK